MKVMLMRKAIILTMIIQFSFASGRGAQHQNLDLEKTESSKKLVEEEDLKFETDPEDLLNFFKGCLIAVFRRPSPHACRDSRRHINSVVKRMGALFGMKEPKNIEFFIDENGQLCYSYNLTREIESEILHCISLDEMLDKLIKRIFFDKHPTHGNDRQDCIGLFPALLVFTCFIVLFLTAAYFYKFKFLYLQAEKENNQISTYAINGIIKKLMVDVQHFQCALHVQLWDTVSIIKTSKIFVEKAQRLASSIEEEILSDAAKLCKNLFLKLIELFSDCYRYLKYHKFIVSMANALSIAFGLQKRDDILTAFLKRLHLYLSYFKLKKRSLKPRLLLKRLPKNKIVGSSTKPFKKQSRNRRGKSRAMSFKTSINNVSFPSKLAVKVIKSDTVDSESISSMPESFCKVYAKGTSKISTAEKIENTKRPTNLSSSFSCDKEVDKKDSKSSSSSQNLMKKINTHQNSSLTTKADPTKLPGGSYLQNSAAPCQETNSRVASNVNQLSYLWNKAEEFPNQHLTSEKPTKRLPAFKQFENSKNNPVDLWSNNLMNVCTNTEQDMLTNIPSEVDHEKAFPPAMQSAWSTNQETHFPINVWNGATDVPMQHSVKKSCRSESSFDFEDSRFNTPKSNRANFFEMQQNFPIVVNRPDLMANKNEYIGDNLNCNKHVNGIEEVKADVSCLKTEDVNAGFQRANNASMQLNAFPTTEILPNVVNAPNMRANPNEFLYDQSRVSKNVQNWKVKTNIKREADLLGAGGQNEPTNITLMNQNLFDVNQSDPVAYQEGLNCNFSHLLNFVDNVNPQTKQKPDTGFPEPCDFRDPMSQFHGDIYKSNTGFAPHAFMPPVDQCWGNNVTQFLLPKDVTRSAIPQSSDSPSAGVAANLNFAAFIFPQNVNASVAFPQNKETNFPVHNVTEDFPKAP